MAVQRHAFASVQRMPKGSGFAISALDLNETMVVDGVEDLGKSSPMPFLAAFVRRLVEPDDSILLVTEVDVPPGSGLGGSGALGVAVTAALDRLYGRRRSAFDTAVLANEIERRDLGLPGGDQDSLGAALGGMNFLEYDVGGKVTPHKIDVSTDTLRTIEHRSLVIYTGAAHVSASIHEDILAAYQQTESETKQALFSLQATALSMRLALQTGMFDSYAVDLNEACRQLYRLHPSCDSEMLKRYFAAMNEHIVAGKTCGAGGGGSIFVLTRPGHRGECIRVVNQLGGQAWPFIIDQEGLISWQAPAFDDEFIHKVRSQAVKQE